MRNASTLGQTAFEPLLEQIESELTSRTKSNTLRVLRTLPHGSVDFASNDYLGILRNREFQSGLASEVSRHATDGRTLSGAGGSRLISGNHESIEELEHYLASHYGAESALVFPSGFDANVALITALGELGDVVFLYDEKIHASMRDGFRLAKARSYHFPHNNLEALEDLLKRQTKLPILFVESVYSMDGDRAPLQELVALMKQYGGELILDEAHSGGIYGPGGRGIAAELGVESNLFARVFPWGKAYGCQGGAVIGSKRLKNLLVNFGRQFIYTTGLSPLLSIAALASYTKVQSCDNERALLYALIRCFCSQGSRFPEGLSQNPSPIQTFQPVEGRFDAQYLRDCSQKLLTAGIYAVPIFHPTVPKGEQRIRISLHAFNSEEEIRKLMTVFTEMATGRALL